MIKFFLHRFEEGMLSDRKWNSSLASIFKYYQTKTSIPHIRNEEKHDLMQLYLETSTWNK